MKLFKLLSYLIPLIFIVWLGIGLFFYMVAVKNFDTDRYYISLDSALKNNVFNKTRFDSIKKENIKVKSQFNYELDGIVLLNPIKTNNTVIICHGIACNKWVMLKYSDIFLDNGFNVVLYDHRAHGESGGKVPSYGYYERQDLQKMVEFIQNKFHKGKIGILGESMGAATVLQHAGYINSQYQKDSIPVSFYIADCPFTSANKEFEFRLKEEYGLPNFGIVETASLWTKIMQGFWFDDANPIKNADKINVPVMIAHGLADNYVPTSMGIELYSKIKSPKTLLLEPDANHAESYMHNPKKYKERVNKFLKENNLLN